jgi:hypothetical protein
VILQGNQRGGAKDLALHLLKEDNDHVDVHELRGFVANDLVSAFNEAYAISRGTKAKQFLFSLSLNPPPSENVSTTSFETAIARVEKKLGLQGQPRAIVFHEKNGRRHCHAVWSRTNTQTMKAIPLPYTKRKLMEISRDLFIEHGWQIPKGMLQSQESDPRNFTLAQWQQAKRLGKDPRAIKEVFQDCWTISDNLVSFRDALKSRGYTLAQGDRRNFVALDHRCEIFAVSKWTGNKIKDIKAKLSDSGSLPSVVEARTEIAKSMKTRLDEFKQKNKQKSLARLQQFGDNKQALRKQQRQLRQEQLDYQETRRVQESLTRQARFTKGLRGFWDRLTGKLKRIRKQNEKEELQCQRRDQREKDALVFKQLEQRQQQKKRIKRLEVAYEERQQRLSGDIGQYQDIIEQKSERFELQQPRHSKSQKLSL